MLELMTQGVQDRLSSSPYVHELLLPDGFIGAVSMQPDALLEAQAGFPTELDSADELLAEPAQETLSGIEVIRVDIPRQSDSSAPVDTVQDVEHWLLSMLCQRESLVQARDNESVLRADEASMPEDLTDVLGCREPLHVMANNPAGSAPVYYPAAKVMGAASSDVESGAASPKIPPITIDVATAESLSAPQSSALERAVSNASSAEVIVGTTTQAAANGALQERTLKLQGPEQRWGEQMLHALRENVEMQVQQRMQSATIRLDPPELGSMEIFLSHVSGRLSVQIFAAQADVARLLQSTSERLRQELVGQNFMHVSVGVSSDGQPGRQHAQQGRAGFFGDESVVANAIDECGEPGASKCRSDVLITV